MGNGAILTVFAATSQNSLLAAARKIVDSLQAGDRFDFDELPEDLRTEVVDEFFLRDYKLSSDGKVGILETCSACHGAAELSNGADCPLCEGYSKLIDLGQGFVPYRD